MPASPLFARGSTLEVRRIAAILRLETVGGALLLVATAIALLWANLAPDRYQAVREFHFGFSALNLDLSVEHWAADGLLAIFFFVAGLELKREFVAGDLRQPRTAALPIAAAVGGMAVPALIYAGGILLAPEAPEGALRGWAIPTATDIAFALGVLAVVGRHLPSALRTFLLTLAVVDDLLAIIVIAVFYTADLAPLPLLLALLPLALFTVLVQRRVRHWYLLLPLALLTWGLVHTSGIHATVAGVLLGLVVPVRRRRAGPGPGLAEHFEHLWRPVSTGFAVPVFALMSAGVTIGGASGFAAALGDPVALAIMAGLVLGKPIGILATTVTLARFTRAELDPSLRWVDVIGMAVLAGIGFTVSLLIGSLAFGGASEAQEHVTLAVLLGSTIAAVLAAIVLATRSRRYKAAGDADGEADTPQESIRL